MFTTTDFFPYINRTFEPDLIGASLIAPCAATLISNAEENNKRTATEIAPDNRAARRLRSHVFIAFAPFTVLCAFSLSSRLCEKRLFTQRRKGLN
jgi:hypothetical protein